MIIRQERPSDYEEVYELVKKSFATTTFSDGTEQDYLNQVRQKDSFIIELSLVAEDDSGKIVGQIVLYETDITTPQGIITELLLSPICVHPDYFRRGIARLMMNESFLIAKKMGYKAVFLCGNPDFYSKVGFKPTYQYHIYHVEDNLKTADWSMVRELVDDALVGISGKISTQ